MRFLSVVILGGWLLAGLSVPGPAAKADLPPIRFMLHGNMSTELPTEDFLRFVEEVKPDILIMGVFDQRLYAAAFPGPKSKAVPIDPRQHLARWKKVADRLHRHGIRLIGQMELFVVSDRPAEREEKSGWFGYYEKGWDTELLGPRPTAAGADLLEAPDWDGHQKGNRPAVPEGDAVARCGCRVNSKALRGCANKPAWKAVHKAMVRAALQAGVDGFITNRNYFEHCDCPHCQAGFRDWLGRRFKADDLHKRLGIADLTASKVCVVGPHRDHDSVPNPLNLEKMRFARHAVQKFFEDVYVRFGREQKPDLIVAQWNHMAYFDELHLDRGHLPKSTRTSFAHASADERWSLPLDLWGRGESFFWYCNWGTTQNTILAREYAGDTVLYGKLLRALARGRPHVINKYDFYRPRLMMAEAAALGYATNAIATPWLQETDRAVMVRYFQFLRRHQDLYRPAETYANIGLIFPRRALAAGDASPLEYVEAAGRTMIRDHQFFDMIPDDMLADADLARHGVLVLASPEYLQDRGKKALARFVQRGGKILLTPVAREDRDRPGAAVPDAKRPASTNLPFKVTEVSHARTARDAFAKTLKTLVGNETSRFDVDWKVEVHAYRQPVARRLVLHLVNYNHDEKGTGKSVTEREAPLEAGPVKIQLHLPEDLRAKRVYFLSPEAGGEVPIEFRQQGRRLHLTTPRFLVYGLCVVQG